LVSLQENGLFDYLFYIYHFQNTRILLLQAATDSVIRAPHMICLSCNTVAKQYRSDLGIIWRHDRYHVFILGAAMKARTFIVCWNLLLR